MPKDTPKPRCPRGRPATRILAWRDPRHHEEHRPSALLGTTEAGRRVEVHEAERCRLRTHYAANLSRSGSVMKLLATVTVVWLLAIDSVAGQVLFDGPLKVAAGLGGVSVDVRQHISNNNDQCAIDRRILEAEAERALRRDGIAVRTTEVVLWVDVVTVQDILNRCASYVDLELVVLANPQTEAYILAASGGSLRTGPVSEHVGQLRTAVEQNVSVIANAIRRARDDQERSSR